MRHLPLAILAALVVSATPVLARERCDIPTPGVHVKVTVGFGHRSAETQADIDQMLLRKAGVNARTATRTGDGCIEAWVPNGDGTFRNEYYDPDVLDLTGDAIKLKID